jgi:hypothetical protein
MFMRYLTIIFCLLIVGCSSTGPLFEQLPPPDKNKALLYIYRPDSLVMLARPASFEIDDEKIVELKNNGYTSLYIPEGKHTVKVLWEMQGFKPIELNVNLIGGQQYFIRSSPGLGYCYECIEYQTFLSEVPSTLGSEEIKTKRLQKNTFSPK